MLDTQGSAAFVGPNAAIQTFAALRVLQGVRAAKAVAIRAGVGPWLSRPPGAMIPEGSAAAIFRAVGEICGAEARHVMAAAGAGTGSYVLAHRIPAPVRSVLPLMPDPIAARLLLAAIRKNAWTFAGSGAVTTAARPWTVEIADNPLAQEGGCAWHAAVFERLFRALVHPRTVARETACCAAGAPACRFVLEVPPK